MDGWISRWGEVWSTLSPRCEKQWFDHLVASKVRLFSLNTCSNSRNKEKQMPLHLLTGILNIFISKVLDFPFSPLLISWIGWSLWNFHFQVFSSKFWFWSFFSQLQPPKHSDSIPQILKSFHKVLLRFPSLRNTFFSSANKKIKFTFMLFFCFDFSKHLLLNKDRPTGRVKNAKKEEETSVDRRAFAGRLTQSPTESRRPSPEARSPKPPPKLRPGNIPRARDGTKSRLLSSISWYWPKKVFGTD